jgi:NDMA-dependent alcohol dehydrogenase
MLTRGAVVRKAPGSYETVDLLLDDPRPGLEVRVEMRAAGLCHSDDHIATGDLPVAVYPFAGGHEGAGVVVEAPPNPRGIVEGDHVVLCFVPSCGHCRFCAMGRHNLCRNGGSTVTGARPGTTDDYRLRLAGTGEPVGQMSGISTFCRTTTVSVDSLVRIEKDLPFAPMALLSCGVGTGWGSAVHDAEVRPGDTVVVMGVGGVGINAVQGASHAGALNVIAVDPVAFKRESALRFGATHAVADIAEAEELARQFTDGQGADSVVVTVGVTRSEHIAQAVAAVRKAGICVLTGVGDFTEVGIDIPASGFAMFGKRLQGSLYGSCSPQLDIPRQIDLYRAGVLKLDELITRTYSQDEIAQAYADLHAGRNIRGVVAF